MLKVMVTGLFNRGQQDEYVELEAAIQDIYDDTIPVTKVKEKTIQDSISDALEFIGHLKNISVLFNTVKR